MGHNISHKLGTNIRKVKPFWYEHEGTQLLCNPELYLFVASDKLVGGFNPSEKY